MRPPLQEMSACSGIHPLVRSPDKTTALLKKQNIFNSIGQKTMTVAKSNKRICDDRTVFNFAHSHPPYVSVQFRRKLDHVLGKTDFEILRAIATARNYVQTGTSYGAARFHSSLVGDETHPNIPTNFSNR